MGQRIKRFIPRPWVESVSSLCIAADILSFVGLDRHSFPHRIATGSLSFIGLHRYPFLSFPTSDCGLTENFADSMIYFIKIYFSLMQQKMRKEWTRQMANGQEEQIRIVQETVAGKEITFAHVMGGPAPIIYQKLGLNPQVDYQSSAIGIMNMTPPESAVIASDIAVKSGNIYLGFADRFTGTLIITGEISDVMSAMTEIVNYFRDTLEYVVCKITKR